ncbi:cellulase family glycosylhydrolase [Chamaesiphon sp. VAR_48_metabat_135_sub]|uniref:cellulase family glycosylhydrolase n=1 Tax=Chamaesiphon sp. VAR_48_metabat_135_sub TaxID=2964699 RepID=UPI00286B9968|nr:cellulase family glycosylhydrolase [Chamaesiphon sp. VAR_48_metabat_135_sub]
MSSLFSRRQILNLGSSFAIGAAGTMLGNTPLFAQPGRTTFYTKGRFLYHPNGTKVILRGVNLPLLDDWGFPQTDTLSELVKTGANAVRIQWYKNYGQANRPTFSETDLDNFLAKCRANQIIPILYLSDLTCKSDPILLNSQLMPWWTSKPVLNVLKKHQNYLIINLANELGHYRWSNNPATALNSFKNAYKTAIVRMRKHLQVPIAIDAPDCGSSIEVFPQIAKELINSDPAQNLLFSGHAYWAAYNGIPHIQAAINANIPLFFGEIANKQDEDVNGKTQYCRYDLDGIKENQPAQNGFTYQSLLTLLQQKEIGWCAWSWWKDNCSKREMTSNGTFAGLTPYGKDIVNNPTYGLKATAKKVAL